MTQNQSRHKPVYDLLQAIDPKGIADESVRRTVEILLNLVEELNVTAHGQLIGLCYTQLPGDSPISFYTLRQLQYVTLAIFAGIYILIVP